MWNLILSLGAILLVIRILCHLIQIWNRKPFVWVKNEGKCWAVVTGAGAGMGFEFARQLALKGYNLMLISLFEHELENAKQKIFDELKGSKQTSIQIRTLAIDFSRVDIYDRVEQFIDLKKNDVFVLVNNVGTNYDLPRMFLSGDYAKRNETIINVNLISLTKMTEIVLPDMVAKQRGLIINMSSGSILYPCPKLTMYTSTKSYVKKLTECLAEEYRSSNITFCSLSPLWVATDMVKASPSAFVPSAKDFVSIALSSIKYTPHFDSDHLYWSHYVQHYWGLFLSVLFTPRMEIRYICWLMDRIEVLDSKLTWFYKNNPGKQPGQLEQLKFFLIDNKID